MEEVSAAAGGGSGRAYASKAAEEAASAGNKAAAAEGKKRMTKTMRVKQAYINSLLEKYPFKPYPWEQLDEKTEPDPEIREMLRAAIAPAAAIMKATRDKDEAIVRQYLALGYAEEEVEIDGDEA